MAYLFKSMAHLILACNIAPTCWFRHYKIYSDELDVGIKNVIMILKVKGKKRDRRKTGQSN